MLRLAASDLVAHLRIWVGALVVACACGLISQYGLCLVGSSGQAGRMFGSVGSTMPLFSAVAVVPVVAATGNLVVARQRGSYALWQLAGVLPGVVRRVVLAQLCMVGAVGALVGSVAASLLYVPTLPVLMPDLVRLADPASLAELGPDWSGVVGSSLLSAALFVVGGLGSARRAARTSPMAALSELERPAPRRPWLRVLVLLACLALLGVLLTQLRSDDVALVTNGALFFPLTVVACFAVLAPWLLSGVLRLWSAPLARLVLPDLARKEARHALVSSTSMELPIMIGFGMLAGVYSAIALLGEWYATHALSYDPTINQTAQVALFGCPIAICLVGAMASALISSGGHSRSAASLALVGMTSREALVVSLLESLMHVVNSLLVGMLAVLASCCVIGLAIGADPLAHLDLASGLPVGVAGLVFVGAVLCASTLRGVSVATGRVGDAARGAVD